MASSPRAGAGKAALRFRQGHFAAGARTARRVNPRLHVREPGGKGPTSTTTSPDKATSTISSTSPLRELRARCWNAPVHLWGNWNSRSKRARFLSRAVRHAYRHSRAYIFARREGDEKGRPCIEAGISGPPPSWKERKSYIVGNGPAGLETDFDDWQRSVASFAEYMLGAGGEFLRRARGEVLTRSCTTRLSIPTRPLWA